MADIRTVVNTSSRHIQVLFYEIKYISNIPLMINLSCYVS